MLQMVSCLQLYQRSADVFLGVPFNIASYSLLLHMVAAQTGLEPGEFVHTFGDTHIYSNHIEQVTEQLQREMRPLPTITLNPEVKDIAEYTMADIKINDLTHMLVLKHQSRSSRINYHKLLNFDYRLYILDFKLW